MDGGHGPTTATPTAETDTLTAQRPPTLTSIPKEPTFSGQRATVTASHLPHRERAEPGRHSARRRIARLVLPHAMVVSTSAHWHPGRPSPACRARTHRHDPMTVVRQVTESDGARARVSPRTAVMALWIGRNLNDACATELGILRAGSPQSRSRCWRFSGIMRCHRTAVPGPARGQERWPRVRRGQGGCRERLARWQSKQPEGRRGRAARSSAPRTPREFASRAPRSSPGLSSGVTSLTRRPWHG